MPWNCTRRNIALITLAVTLIAIAVWYFGVPSARHGASDCVDSEQEASGDCMRVSAASPGTGSGAGGSAEPLPTPANVLAQLTERIDTLVGGSAAVRAPLTATRGESFQVHLDVAPKKIEALLADKLIVESRVAIDQVRLTPVMIARLEGLGFEVLPKDAIEQAISASEVTSWSWQVRATDSGLLKLQMRLSGSIEFNGKEIPREFYNFSKDIQVSVGFVGFVEKYWQWIVTTFLLPVVGTVWALTRKSKSIERADTIKQKTKRN